MEDIPDDASVTRPPNTRDLLNLCRKLNEQGAAYIVMGGMAVNIHGFIRATEEIDFLVRTTPENERIILEVLSQLPEGAAKELKPGEVSDYVVVRICDEFTVDLMAKACGMTYEEAKDSITWIQVEDVLIPYASPTLLWKTKQTYREKDEIDLLYLKKLLQDRGEWPVE
jgi:hypothetical protein